jgi:DNA mismatch repair protein MLH3
MMHSVDTSRFPTRPDVHGRTGTFLASVAALSLLSVASHHEGHHSHNSIQIHNSRVLARHTPSPPEQRLLSFSHGTRATVHDLFGVMPVRVKQRAASADGTASSRDWDQLKIAVVALMLPWPEQVSMSLRDSTSQQSAVIRNHGRIAPDFPDHLRRSGLVSRVSGLLGQAGLSEEISRDSWVSLKASAGSLSVCGAVCLVPVATRRVQFISIGIQPLSNERGSNVLYEEINRVFANSSFGAEDETSSVDEAEKSRRVDDQRYKTDGYTNRELRSKRGIDRWPMFHIRIDLDELHSGFGIQELEGVLDDRQPSLQMIVDVLKAMVYEFLKKHHFRPAQYKKRKRVSPVPAISERKSSETAQGSVALPPRPASRDKSHTKSLVTVHTVDLAATRFRSSGASERRPQLESPFDRWSRIKHDHQTNPAKTSDMDILETHAIDARNLVIPDTATRVSREGSDPPLFDSSGNLVRAPFLDAEGDATPDREDGGSVSRTQGDDHQTENDEHVTWINPITKQRSIIDQRTGLLVSSGDPSKDKPSRLTATKRLRTTEEPRPKEQDDNWVSELLSTWENPVFDAVEPRIPAAYEETKLFNSFDGIRDKQYWCQHTIPDGAFRVEGRVSKDALRRADIIAQVDRKFILAKLPLSEDETTGDDCNSASLLVIIDQHAADERCRVESLMKDYFTVDTSGILPAIRAKTQTLVPALQYEISAQERSLFDRYASYFNYWGIKYQVTSISPDQLRQQIKLPSFLKVRQLPGSISERCRSEPRLLIDLLRKEAWKLDGNTRNPTSSAPATSSQTGTGLHWLSRLHDCPQGIVEIVNSRACRSAIMFNDVLSLDECKSLLFRLADCAFPFQCAHGRPSMIPMVDLGDSGVMHDQRAHTMSFGKQFKHWRGSCRNSQ